jgi:hypothetical protein
MNKLSQVIFLLVVLLCGQSCTTEDFSSSQEVEKAYLDHQLTQILDLATCTRCDSGSDCRFTDLGSKPCGGPRYYLIYQSNVDTAKLLQLVKLYNRAEMAFNKRWEIGSDCIFEPQPDSVRCLNGDCIGYWDGETRSVYGPPPKGR